MSISELLEPTIVADVDPLLGRLLDDRYRVVRMIGRGGAGVVYLARDRDAQRDVVVKFLADGLLCDSDAVARFRREADQLARTRHDNIVTMLDHGQDGRRVYLVMEYVPGVLLDRFITEQGGRLSLRQFVPIAAQILKGMGHAHSRDLMIRDIKPSNVMLCTRKGRANFVKILDFGLAKQLREEVPITGEHIVGTVGFLAPETLSGEPTDLRVDVYAAGVLFYYMLCGRLPFVGKTASSVFYQTVHDPIPDLATLLPQGHGVPQPLLQLISDCVEKNPERRPADANAIVERLIDSVSASLFRLPKADPGAPMPAAFGNTGMFKMVSSDDPAPAANGSVSTKAPIPMPPTESVRSAPPQRNQARSWGVFGLGVLLTSAVVAVPLLSTPEPPASEPAGALIVSAAPTAPEADAAANPQAAPPIDEPTTAAPPADSKVGAPLDTNDAVAEAQAVQPATQPPRERARQRGKRRRPTARVDPTPEASPNPDVPSSPTDPVDAADDEAPPPPTPEAANEALPQPSSPSAEPLATATTKRPPNDDNGDGLLDVRPERARNLGDTLLTPH